MTKKYLNRIDAVRGIAILLVLSYHTLLGVYPNYETKTYATNGFLVVNDLKSFLLNFNPVAQGWIGVELFLVISGFLIHFIYLQNQQDFKWSAFFSKRFWRIYPPYLLVLLFFFINRPDFSNAGIINFFSHVFLAHNLSDSTIFSINPGFWSIALEVQLYLIYPLYLSLIKHFSAAKTIIFLLLTLIAFTVADIVFAINKISYATFVFKFWFVWAAGAYLAEQYFQNIRIFKKPILWVLFFYLLFFVFKLYYLTNYFILIPAALCCVALMEAILYSRSLDKYLFNRLAMKYLSFVGLISYSIYLIHQPYLNDMLNFYSRTTNYPQLNNLIRVSFTYVTVFLISYSLYKLVELKSIEYGKLIRRK